MADHWPALAIVIPAYRLRYLGEALASLDAQTDKRFRLYIGDDASPEPLHSTVDAFRARLNLRYKRFDSNLGGTNLISHWHRCIALSEAEPWIWLFSDDDLMDPECVSRFYETLGQKNKPPVELFRFQLDQINERSTRFARGTDHPEYETSDAFLRALLTDRDRAFRAQEHIFSRHIYESSGGFVDFPKAIYSDHATWLRFSAQNGVRTIPGARVMWRRHPCGTTSGMRGANRIHWQAAARSYLKWLDSFAREQGPQAMRIFQLSGLSFYFRAIASFRPKLTKEEFHSATCFSQELFRCSRLKAHVQLYYALVEFRFSQWRERVLASPQRKKPSHQRLSVDSRSSEPPDSTKSRV